MERVEVTERVDGVASGVVMLDDGADAADVGLDGVAGLQPGVVGLLGGLGLEPGVSLLLGLGEGGGGHAPTFFRVALSRISRAALITISS